MRSEDADGYGQAEETNGVSEEEVRKKGANISPGGEGRQRKGRVGTENEEGSESGGEEIRDGEIGELTEVDEQGKKKEKKKKLECEKQQVNRQVNTFRARGKPRSLDRPHGQGHTIPKSPHAKSALRLCSGQACGAPVAS